MFLLRGCCGIVLAQCCFSPNSRCHLPVAIVVAAENAHTAYHLPPQRGHRTLWPPRRGHRTSWRFRRINVLPPPPKPLPPKRAILPTAVINTAKTITSTWHCCRRITAILRFYRVRRSRYRQTTQYRLPPKNMRRYGVTTENVKRVTLPSKPLVGCKALIIAEDRLSVWVWG